MQFLRTYWVDRIEQAWRRRPIVWLSGVRRVGKTSLAQSLQKVEYFDCELPRVRRMMEDSESFLKGLKGKRIVLDEVHRLQNPSEILKIAADHFSSIKILATGSSTLQASAKFRDTLAGRKEEIWLTPLNLKDGIDFGNEDLKHRLRHGGLPPFFLNPDLPEREYQEWMDSYWAKDIQELFHLERRASFQRFLELLFVQSGGIFEATRFAAPCEISRGTVTNYLTVLESTRVAQVVRPFSSGNSSEIVSAPKVYAFDTGFICYHRGWETLRPTDYGSLWEHYVLNELCSYLPLSAIHYWRDKRGHEVDYVILPRRGAHPLVIECKWKSESFDLSSLRSFRERYPKGENWVVSMDADRPYRRREKGLEIEYVGIQKIAKALDAY